MDRRNYFRPRLEIPSASDSICGGKACQDNSEVMEFPVELLPVLRELIAGEQSFSGGEALCAELERFPLCPLAYFRSGGKLPAPWRRQFCGQFRQQAGNAFRQQFAFGS